MLKDPFPSPERQSSGSHRIGGAYFAQLKVKSPKAKILVLVGLLVLLLLASFLLKGYSQSEVAKTVTEEVPSVQIGSDKPRRFSGIPALDPTIAERISDLGPEARRRWPSKAIGYLLYESAYTPAVSAYGRDLIPMVPGSAEQIRKDSRPWRFKYFVFRGRLESVEEQNYETVYGKYDDGGGEIGQIRRGRVLVAGGDSSAPPLRITFVTTRPMMWRDRNEVNPSVRPIEDGWVRVRGIFVKNYLDETAEGGATPTMLVVATQIDRDYERLPVNTLADVPFDQILDDPSIASTREGQDILAKNYPRALYRLVKYAESRAGEEGAELREKEGLKALAIDDPKTYEEVIGHPAQFRGEYFGGYGIIAETGYRFDASSIEPNDAGVEECFDGWIMTDKNKLVQFVAPWPLMKRDWPKMTRIRWAGYFYKAKGYPAANRTRRLAPFVVLTELEQVYPSPPDYTSQFIFAGAFLAGLLLLVWIIIRNDAGSEDFRRTRKRKIADA
ncbi:MAG: hypothetical protein ACYTGZ_21525 [Planctomycetota bacterium]|jgi:hypothetical protein